MNMSGSNWIFWMLNLLSLSKIDVLSFFCFFVQMEMLAMRPLRTNRNRRRNIFTTNVRRKRCVFLFCSGCFAYEFLTYRNVVPDNLVTNLTERKEWKLIRKYWLHNEIVLERIICAICTRMKFILTTENRLRSTANWIAIECWNVKRNSIRWRFDNRMPSRFRGNFRFTNEMWQQPTPAIWYEQYVNLALLLT